MKNKLCVKCLHFYCCNLSQVTKDCPIIKPTPQTGHKVLFPNPPPLKPFVGDDDHAPDNVDRGGIVHPQDDPFDHEFGLLKLRMALELLRQKKPYIPWDAKEGL